MIIRFTDENGASRSGYVTGGDGATYRVCVATGDYVSVPVDQAEIV